MMKPDLKKWLAYFKKPLPGREGFSPYRFPGLAVHIPVFLIISAIGIFFNDSTGLVFFIPVYVVMGLYLGRDIAIYGHYNPLILFGVWGILFFAANLYQWTLKPLRTYLGGSLSFFSLGVDLILILVFFYYVRSWLKDNPD